MKAEEASSRENGKSIDAENRIPHFVLTINSG